MAVLFKAKVAHVFEDGSVLQYETILEAQDHQGAYQAACDGFTKAVKALAGKSTISVTKSKLEGGYEKH